MSRPELRETADSSNDDGWLEKLKDQIEGLGNRFGSYTAGPYFSGIASHLKRHCGEDHFIAPRAVVRRNGLEEEYDILAYSSGTLDKRMIVEIKSKLRKEDLAQMKRKMDGIFTMLPEHSDKTFQGMIACVSASADLKKQVLENGWYLAHIGDDLFELETPENFVARTYSAAVEPECGPTAEAVAQPMDRNRPVPSSLSSIAGRCQPRSRSSLASLNPSC